jgi:hypothetical protein
MWEVPSVNTIVLDGRSRLVMPVELPPNSAATAQRFDAKLRLYNVII